MAYTVTAPLVIAKNAAGADVYVYDGGVVPDGQGDEWVKHHLDMKMIAEGGEAPASETSDDDRPAGNASRDEWESYALAHGRTEDELAELGRDEIRDLFA